MIKNTLTSITDNINQKIKNPFLGTFIIAWIIRNWEFLYSIFNFSPKLSLENRIITIKAYFVDYGITEILITIGFAFIILISTYILLNLSRLIVNFFNKIITPKISKITDKSSIVLKSTYDDVITNIDLLEAKVQAEKEARLKIQNENEKLEERIKELLSQKNEKSDDFSNRMNVSKTKSEEKADLLVTKLKKDNMIDLFEDVASNILNAKPMLKKENHIKKFVDLGLMIIDKFAYNESYLFKLTDIGTIVYEDIVMEKIK